MSLCSLRLGHRCQVRLVVFLLAPTMAGKITLVCSGPAVPLLPTVWELHVIFSSVSGKLIQLCPPSWEAPKLWPLFRQCLR